jgi:hypothetical protein
MAATTAIRSAKPSPTSVLPGEILHVDEFRRHVGWGLHAMRQARRNGLTVIYTGGRAYVRADDFRAYLDKAAHLGE